jgi:hypothetical protein
MEHLMMAIANFFIIGFAVYGAINTFGLIVDGIEAMHLKRSRDRVRAELAERFGMKHAEEIFG